MRNRLVLAGMVYAAVVTIGTTAFAGPLGPHPSDTRSLMASTEAVDAEAALLLCDGCFWGTLGRNNASAPMDIQGMLNATSGSARTESEESESTPFFRSVLNFLLSRGSSQ
jgi:hypothetical protein